MKRFWSKVAKRGPRECWPWTAYTDRDGYGWVAFEGRRVGAHRVAYILTYGHPMSGLDVCHRCDNPSCVNPAHLFLATRKGNLQDMVRKGRSLSGEDHNMAKLTWEAVRDIRSHDNPDTSTRQRLADRYGVTRWTINAVLRGLTWKNDPEDQQREAA